MYSQGDARRSPAPNKTKRPWRCTMTAMLLFTLLNALLLHIIAYTTVEASQEIQSQAQLLVDKMQTDPRIRLSPSDSSTNKGEEESVPTEQSEKSVSPKKKEPVALLNRSTIQNHLLLEAPWAESHGADHQFYVAAGMLYYSFAYAFQSKTIVVLGSGGGFVPRMLRQAQRDMELAGLEGDFKLILVDANLPSAGWGSTFYADNKDTVMWKKFSDIRYIFEKTDDAYEMLKKEGVAIDYLHVDADHSFEQSYKDFDNFYKLLAPRAVVSFHDTCRDTTSRRKCTSGVPQTIDAVRDPKYGMQMLDAQYLYRGIAFAIRQDAPVLSERAQPSGSKALNFCTTNAALIHKTAAGWSKNADKGDIESLGSFYNCQKKFDMATLGASCPVGTRRGTKNRCIRCVAGHTGKGCKNFVFEEERRARKLLSKRPTGTPTNVEHMRMTTAWLGERNSQHILELGVSQPLLADKVWHAPKSVWSLDPGTDDTIWQSARKDTEIPKVRRLPIPYHAALLKNTTTKKHDFTDVLPRDTMDALVCHECELQLSSQAELSKVVEAMPDVTTLVLELNTDSGWLDTDTSVESFDDGSWQVESDLLLGSRRGFLNKTRSSAGAASTRRMLFLTKRR